jgi:RimJ/RimL family protein N-acetyltransferase
MHRQTLPRDCDDSTVPEVSLRRVDEPILAALVESAVADSDPSEVIPPLPGSVGWDEAARDKLRSMHRECYAGLAGPQRQETYAVLVDGLPRGAIRLQAKGGGVYETGMWLTRGERGRGVGTAALRAITERAREAGGAALVADTTEGNAAAQHALLRLGFGLASRGDGSRIVDARLELS